MPKKKEITIDDLAGMIKKGFDGVDVKFKKVENKLHNLEQGQEDIKLRLCNVAYRFELQDLEERLFKCERKLGLAKSKGGS